MNLNTRALIPLGLAFALIFAGCRAPQPPAEREAEAKKLFNDTVQTFHLPSARASGAARNELLEKAAAGYSKVIATYGDEKHWAAQATRSLGNVRAEQGRLDDAVALYEKVARRYPGEGWEVLQSLKSAADLLWEAGQTGRARPFYGRIVERFSDPNEPPVVRIIVKQAGKRAREAKEN
jgi:tetratricopeptide (TPR) repeat protein